ncbi:hypothetical protein BV20DRAFT_774316 [Pilatotrama ljubarskyi]|nr:hypothetical protein BV20DRAFT_774316 [Pilatotrama ljubarskyi]
MVAQGSSVPQFASSVHILEVGLAIQAETVGPVHRQDKYRDVQRLAGLQSGAPHIECLPVFTMPLRLPVEIIERTVGFLDGDIPSLSACALTCRALLPASRVYIWRDVALPMNYRGVNHPRSAAFLNILKDNPDIAPYVRSLSLNPRKVTALHSAGPAWHRHNFRPTIARFPNLRALRLCNFNGRRKILSQMLAMAYDVPGLEVLCIENLGIHNDDGQDDPDITERLFDPSTPAQWRLKEFSIVRGCIPPVALPWLVSWLELLTDYAGVSLESLDLRPGSERLPSTSLPSWPGVPSFAPSLRHLGVSLGDIRPTTGTTMTGREHMLGIFTALPHYRSLCSLCLQYDLPEAFELALSLPHIPPPRFPSPSFLELLADVLSATEEPPFPLEHLTLVFASPPGWLVEFKSGLERLAQALVGDVDRPHVHGAARRYPGFSRLHVRTSAMETVARTGDNARIERYEKERAERDVEHREAVSLMLERFARAGVHVEVCLD